MVFQPGHRPKGDADDDPHPRSWWFVFNSDELLVRQIGDRVDLPRGSALEDLGIHADVCHHLGQMDGAPVYAVRADGVEGASVDGLVFHNLRQLFGAMGDEAFRVAGRAKQIMTWDRDHQYCGRCGEQTQDSPSERAKVCPRCGSVSFPRLSPAMITAVVRDGQLLMARANRFPNGFFSVLAGFVEAGESIEDCVHREIREEVGIEVDDVQYFGSQSWPFPHSMMVAFTARYASGEITIDPSEIREARWYKANEVPERIPDRASISRRLIDWFVDTYGGGDRP